MLLNRLKEYIDARGKSPYSQWLHRLRDAKTIARIIIQVDRMGLDLFGDARSIGDGVSELRIHFGPGYRVYFAKEERRIILLLCGGDKSSQAKDIK